MINFNSISKLDRNMTEHRDSSFSFASFKGLCLKFASDNSTPFNKIAIAYDDESMIYDEKVNILYKNLDIRRTDQILDMVLEFELPDIVTESLTLVVDDSPIDIYSIIETIELENSGMILMSIPGRFLETIIKLKYPSHNTVFTAHDKFLRIPLPFDLEQPLINTKNQELVAKGWCTATPSEYHTQYQVRIRLKSPHLWPAQIVSISRWKSLIVRQRFCWLLTENISSFLSELPFIKSKLYVKHCLFDISKRDKLRKWSSSNFSVNNYNLSRTQFDEPVLQFSINNYSQLTFNLLNGQSGGQIHIYTKKIKNIMFLIDTTPEFSDVPSKRPNNYQYNDLESIVIYADEHIIYNMSPTICWMNLLEYFPHFKNNFTKTKPIYILSTVDDSFDPTKVNNLRFTLKSRPGIVTSGRVFMCVNYIQHLQYYRGMLLRWT